MQPYFNFRSSDTFQRTQIVCLFLAEPLISTSVRNQHYPTKLQVASTEVGEGERDVARARARPDARTRARHRDSPTGWLAPAVRRTSDRRTAAWTVKGEDAFPDGPWPGTGQGGEVRGARERAGWPAAFWSLGSPSTSPCCCLLASCPLPKTVGRRAGTGCPQDHLNRLEGGTPRRRRRRESFARSVSPSSLS